MFKITEGVSNQFKKSFETHRLHIATMNIFYNNIRLLNNHHKFLDRETYNNYCTDLLKDIELVTSPIDAIIPCDETVKELFVVNQLVPEYEEILSIMTLEKLYEIIPPTHEVHIKLKDNPNILTNVIDDIFIYFCIYKYLRQIDIIRINTFSNMKEIIEYVVNNVTLKDIKSFLISKKTDENKYEKYCKDILFNPDVAATQKFYSKQHNDIPAIDILSLMMRLSSNIVIKSDIYIIIGIYLILSFSISDIVNNKEELKLNGKEKKKEKDNE